jgi:hypothetical protein
MLGSVALRGGELLAAAIVLLAAVATAGWLLSQWARRWVRSRIGRLGTHVAGPARWTAAGAARGGQRWLWPLPGRRRAAAGLAGWRLWRAVGAAEHAVARAREAGAPVGDLDGLCRRLREAAHEVDRWLMIGSRTAGPGTGLETGRPLVDELAAVAGRIQAMASEAAAAVSWPTVRGLASDVAREVTALSAGIEAASRAGLPGPR